MRSNHIPNHLLQDLFSDIQPFLHQIEYQYGKWLTSDSDYILELIQYLFQKSGKKLRPALVFFCSQIPKQSQEFQSKIIDLALAVELIHAATLVHDDIIDNSDLRRGIETYNKKWGRGTSILFGDFLFSKAFVILASLENPLLLHILSQATAYVCEGEIIQSSIRGNVELTLKEYLKIIEFKTSSLIAASCHVGAVMCMNNPVNIDHVYHYGLNLGMAFQIYDDYLDFCGNEQKLGKPVYNDIKNGFYTLPVLHFFSQMDNKERSLWKQRLQNHSFDEWNDIFYSEMKHHDCFQHTLHIADDYLNKARDYAGRIHNEDLKKQLLLLSEFIIKRDH